MFLPGAGARRQEQGHKAGVSLPTLEPNARPRSVFKATDSLVVCDQTPEQSRGLREENVDCERKLTKERGREMGEGERETETEREAETERQRQRKRGAAPVF